ncbi:hypothetical protein R50072_00450 [Simiduia litorea]|uniref:HzsA-related protein n=1 Tax=Simiduia litorea TaxID=1435348 RepID=UPI0036F232E0
MYKSTNKAPSSLILVASTLALLWGCESKVETGVVDDLEPDPVVLDIPMAYINRPIPVDEDGARISDDVLMPQTFMPGAVLYLKDRAASTAAQVDITSQAWPEGELYDVKDVTASYDGERLLFAMRAPEIEDADEEDQPKWNIWEYDIPSATLRRVINDDIQAEVGHDVSPHYLPGVERRIVFASSRQTRSRAVLLDDNKPQFSALDDSRNEESFVIHVMDNDGTNIEQLTYNQSHDFQPTLLPDGRIFYSRWDRMTGNNQLSFYAVDPYGMHQTLEYGYHSQNTGTDDSQAFFVRPQQLPDGRIFGILRNRESTEYGGDMVAIDHENYISATTPVYNVAGSTGQVSVSVLPINTDDSLSANGIFHSSSPLFDGTGRMIVSWSRCRVINPTNNLPASCTEEFLADPTIVAADPLYGIYIYNAAQRTQQPVLLPIEGRMLVEPLLLIPRTADNLIPPPVANVDFDATLADQGLGSLHIKSVYDFDGTDSIGIEGVRNPANWATTPPPARFLRLVKAVSIPSDEVLDFPNTAFGRSAANGMREILGYVPIEPDGSVMAQVPADVAFTFDIINAQGKRIFPRHNNWLQLRPGEQRNCNGCHTRASEMPHGRIAAEAPSANPGAPTSDAPFPNTDPTTLSLVQMGETMAEAYARLRGMRIPSVDLVYDDDWTDPAVQAKQPSFAYRYADLLTVNPTSPGCGIGASPWGAQCRVTIHYVDHIQPLWDLSRPDDPMAPTVDNQCTSCHTNVDAMAAAMVPAAQLDLRAEPDPQQQAHFVGYRELLFNDVEQEIVNGALVDRLVEVVDANGNPVYQRDADGNLILDGNGDPIPVPPVTVPVQASMSTNGAGNSNRFFNVFANAGATVDHRGFLTDAELKLIAEWIDLGAQYYNNPFAVPVN